jgi:hypothetical protein
MVFSSCLRNRTSPFPRAAKARAAAPGKAAFRHLFIEELEDRCLLSTAASLVNLPLSFEPNVGQADAAVRYLTHGSGYALSLTDRGALLDLHRAGAGGQDAQLRMQLVGGSATPALLGLDPQAGHSNYLIGNDPSKWHTDVPLFGRVEYRQVYAGIDVVYYGNGQHQLEYDFILAAGADPGQIGLRFDGAQGLGVDARGNLVLHLAGGDVVQQAPVVYQDVGGMRTPVTGAYLLRGDGTVGVTLGAYDPTRTLVVDPVLIYSDYLDGVFGPDYGFGLGMAVDGAGNAYATGGSSRSQVTVVKVNAAGNALVYATTFGGSRGDSPYAIAVDGAGNAYITGETDSLDFPTPNGYQTTNNSLDALEFGVGGDAFVAKLNAAGNALLYSTYLGESAALPLSPPPQILDDGTRGLGIAVDGAGNAYVTGFTASTNFPTANALQPSIGGAANTPVSNAFVTKLDTTKAGAASLIYSTYLGGSRHDEGQGIAVDGAGNAYVTGDTNSTDFRTVNPLQQSNGGAGDAFVAKLNGAGNALVYSTYLGGSKSNEGRGIAVDGAGNAYVTGFTESINFPTTPNGYQTTNTAMATAEGNTTAFVAKLNAAGSALLYSTYLGGSGIDEGLGIAVDSAGNAYVTGATSSIDFPTSNPLQGTNGGEGDAFVAKVNPSASGIASLVFSTYLGGSRADSGLGIAVDSAGNIYVTGDTFSSDFPDASHLPVANVIDNNAAKVFVAKLPDRGPLAYTTPLDNSQHELYLQRNGPFLDLYDNGVAASRVYDGVSSVSMTVSNGLPALIIIDDSNGPIDVPGGISVDGGSGGSTLQILDQALADGPLSDYQITNTQVIRRGLDIFSPPQVTITYQHVARLEVNGPNQGSPAFDVSSTAAGTPVKLTTGPCTNTLHVGDGLLGSLQADVTIKGQGGANDLTVDDSAATGPVNYDLSSTILTRSGAANIHYSGLTSLALDAGGGTNTIDVEATRAGTPATVNAGTGTNVINVGDGFPLPVGLGYLGFFYSDVTVKGQGGTNQLTVDDGGNPVPVTYDLGSGTVNSSAMAATIHYSGMTSLVVDGGSGGNTFDVTGTAPGCATTLNGGSGQDTFTGSFTGDFIGSLALADFEAATLDVSGDFNGSLLARTLGTLAAPMDHITIHGSLQAGSRIKVGYLHTLSVTQDLNGTVDGYGTVNDPKTQFTIGPVTMGGTFGTNGSITAPSIQLINMQQAPFSLFAGHATETMPGADFQSLLLVQVQATFFRLAPLVLG